MLHSGHLAANLLTGNGLTLPKAHYLGVQTVQLSTILWSIWRSQLSRFLSDLQYDDFEEDSTEDHYPEKDGFLAYALAAKAIAAPVASVRNGWKRLQAK